MAGMLASAWQANAQFGGRPGDTVIFLLTSKGNADLQVVPSTTANPAATLSRFEVIDPSKLPFKPEDQPGPAFPAFRLQVLHDEADDKMQLLTNLDNIPVVHHLYMVTFKLLTLRGFRREYGDEGEEILDIPPNVYSTFRSGVDIGPNVAFEEEQALVWTSKPSFPPFVPTPRNQHGPDNGDRTGTQLLLDGATFPVLVPWQPLHLRYTTQGWPDGMDIKFIENDPTVGSIAQMIRLRPGRRTPTFRINGATHMYILEGSVEIAPTGAPARLASTAFYAFIPPGLAFTLNNSRAYVGPQPAK